MKRFRNFGWLSTEDIVRLILTFGVMILLARHLGPRGFGALGYVFGVVGLTTPLTAFGLDIITMRRLVAQPEDRDRILGTALVIRLAGATIAMVIAIGFVAIAGGPEIATVELTTVASLTLLFLPWQSFNLHFKAIERPAWVAIPRIFLSLINATTGIWLIALGAGIMAFTMLRAAEACALAVLAVIVYGRFTRSLFGLRIDFSLLRTMIGEGTPLFLSAIAGIIYMRIDQVMLGQLSPVETLGQYNMAVRFVESAFFVPMALQSVFYPGLVKAAAAGNDSLRVELLRYYDIVALAMIALAVMVGAVANILIILLLGPDYTPAIGMAWVLALGLPFIGIGIARTAFLTISGALWTSPLTTAIGAFVNIALNFILIPYWGGVGAACASVVSYWIAAHGTCFLLPWLRPTGHDMTRALNPVGATRRIFGRWQAQRSASATA